MPPSSLGQNHPGVFASFDLVEERLESLLIGDVELV